jgi:hypothetical protein
MIKTFTFVKKLDNLTNDEFFARWTQHTKEFDLVDHPYITKNRLMLIAGQTDYIGIAENHWPTIEYLLETGEFYKKTEKGRAHWQDLASFMDINSSPTVIVTHEAEVDARGIHQIFPPEGA